MLIYAKQEGLGLTASAVRNQMVDGLVSLSFAKQLWVLFRALIYHGLTGIKQKLGCSVDQVMHAIEEHINHFFVQALQLDPYLRARGFKSWRVVIFNAILNSET